jgi:hypothetical protein
MQWPHSQDYNEAIQDPAVSVSDPDLRQGRAVTNALGIPQPCSGNFADVYAVECPASGAKWAVKCFTREVPGRGEHYRQISSHLSRVRLPFLVDFAYLDQGIRVGGAWYPVVKMPWVDGLPLNECVRKYLDQPEVFEALCHLWLKLAGRLWEAHVIHGDLQHGNVLLVPNAEPGTWSLKLVDYDGLCVEGLTPLVSAELGHPAYQHPQRVREGVFGPGVDRFSLLVIYTALRSLAVHGRGLWERYDTGDNLLFRAQDLEAPGSSPLLHELLDSPDPQVSRLALVVRLAARQPLDRAPALEMVAAASQARATAARPDYTPVAAAPATMEFFPFAAPPPVRGQPAPVVTAAAVKRCPYCAERNESSAARCGNCGWVLGPSGPPDTDNVPVATVVATVVEPPAFAPVGPPPSPRNGLEPPATWAPNGTPASAEMDWTNPPPVRQAADARNENGHEQAVPPLRHRPSRFGLVLGILILVLGHGAIVLWLWPWLMRHGGH